MFEDFGALIEGGGGGGDIVDEPNIFSLNVCRIGSGRLPGKGIANIFISFPGIVDAHLWQSEARTRKSLREWDRELRDERSTEFLREEMGLIEAAPPKTQGMKRDGAEDVREWYFRMRDGLHKELPERMAQSTYEAVLIQMDSFGKQWMFV